ncbi:MAG TPA: HEAT repeat domain-containing protein [Terriglobales bacterium]|nr:HEAT repeat domain-containing protein [Terriglobales bacterium]
MSMRNDCEQAAALLPDLWNGLLDAPERSSDRLWLLAHVQACGECAAMTELWHRLGALPAAEPDARQRQRFDQMLAAYQAGIAAPAAPVRTLQHRPAAAAWKQLFWHPLPALAAVVLLAVGLGAGWWLRGGTGAARPADNTAQQVAELRQQVQATQQLAVLSLLRQSSPSDRLQGVSYSTPLVASDPQVVEALLHSLQYDSSPDVRLAAIDTLTSHAGQPGIRSGLMQSFSYQKSPLVQIALVDSFAETRDQQARPLLQRISKDTAYNPEVRKRAAWVLAQPTWN